MCRDSQLSDHPASNSLRMMFPMHSGYCVSEFDPVTTFQWGLDRTLPVCSSAWSFGLGPVSLSSPENSEKTSVFMRLHCLISPIKPEPVITYCPSLFSQCKHELE